MLKNPKQQPAKRGKKPFRAVTFIRMNKEAISEFDPWLNGDAEQQAKEGIETIHAEDKHYRKLLIRHA